MIFRLTLLNLPLRCGPVTLSPLSWSRPHPGAFLRRDARTYPNRIGDDAAHPRSCEARYPVSDHWPGQPERGSRILMQFLTWMTLRVGRPVTRWFLYPICLYFLVFSGGRDGYRAYLQRILGRPAGWRDVFRHYHAFASTTHDRVYLFSGRHRYFDIRMEGESIVQDAFSRSEAAFCWVLIWEVSKSSCPWALR